MTRVCTICTNPQRASIEAAIVAGTSYRDISCQFAVGRMSIERHAQSHVAQEIKDTKVAQDEARAFDVVKQLREINDVARAIMRQSVEAKKNGTALFAIDRIQKQLELQAKLLGDLDERPQVNIWLSPEWHSIRSTIVQTLAPFPDARVAVAGALSQLEAGRAGLN